MRHFSHRGAKRVRRISKKKKKKIKQLPFYCLKMIIVTVEAVNGNVQAKREILIVVCTKILNFDKQPENYLSTSAQEAAVLRIQRYRWNV